MPTAANEPIQIVVPFSLQMGWVDSPGYFSGASETARDVAAEYAKAPIGALPKHHLERKTELPPALAEEMTRLKPIGQEWQSATAGMEKKRARDSLCYLSTRGVH